MNPEKNQTMLNIFTDEFYTLNASNPFYDITDIKSHKLYATADGISTIKLNTPETNLTLIDASIMEDLELKYAIMYGQQISRKIITHELDLVTEQDLIDYAYTVLKPGQELQSIFYENGDLKIEYTELNLLK